MRKQFLRPRCAQCKREIRTMNYPWQCGALLCRDCFGPDHYSRPLGVELNPQQEHAAQDIAPCLE